jgi:serine/threonine protein kinase
VASYTLREKLQTTRQADLFRAVRTEDRRPVVLKILAGSSGPEEPRRLRHELALATECPLHSLLQPLALDSYDGRPALVMEDFEGRPLDQLTAGRPMALEQFLPLARRVANAVAALHACGVVHRDLQPQNLLLSAAGEVRIAGLGIATRGLRDATSPEPPAGIQGSLPYVSPEQTGRTNRPIDARSDLYTLGVTFFQLLTGALPFEAEDAVGWVHCHVARRPPAPVDRVRGLPRVVSDLVLRLLAKLPEERYQSAVGLEHDLARCEEAWTTYREIPPFPLGEHDWSGSLRFTRKLVGREAERSELVAAVDRVASGSGPELVLVSGEPGVGKSTLVEDIQAPVGSHNGAFVAVKFEQYKR